MKVTSLLQRRRQHRAAPSIALFPFLAVLICTMGALVPLLFAITRQARLQAAQQAATKLTEQQGEVKVERELIQWRVEQWKDSRQKTEAQLAEARMELGHLEDHARRLREQAEELRTARGQLDQLSAQDERQESEREAELARVDAQLADARRRLGDAQQAAARRPRSYAVVPYEGPNQTHRRPIYIECRSDAVVLQPENIELSETDFEGPLGPGNPLAAALRAAREFLLAQGGFDPQRDGEPYPLLLVRPDGIAAYYAARSAMKSWGSEFGYELIDDDWKLDFPPRDPQLAQVVARAVQGARVQQEQLIAAAPRSYNHRPGATYRVLPGYGGIVPDGGREDDDDGPVFQRRQPAGRLGGQYRAGQGYGAGAPGGPGAPYGWGGPSGSWEASGTGTGGGAAVSPGEGSEQPGTAGGERSGVAAGERGGAAAGGRAAMGTGDRSGVAAGERSGAATGERTTGATGGGSPKGSRSGGGIADGPPREQPAQKGPSDPDAPPGTPVHFGEWQPREEPPRQKPDESKHADKEEKSRRAGKGKNLALTRGKDWALPDATRNSVPITRPIRIDLYADHLAIVPEKGLAGGKQISLGPRTEGSVDELISAVWSHMGRWGIAGKGMYWRPVLHVHVAPGAEPRFRDLERILDGSGLSVERKQ